MKDETPIVGWLQLGFALLVQTALVASFVYGIYVRVCLLEDGLKDSRADRAVLHSELRTFDQLRYQLEGFNKGLDGINTKLDRHMEKEGNEIKNHP